MQLYNVIMTDKYLFISTLNHLNVASPKLMDANNLDLNSIAFPVFVKPSKTIYSHANMRKCHNKDELFINTNKMTIETKYEYKYYTILDAEGIFELLREAGTIDEMMDTLTLQERHSIWIESLNKLFKNSKDNTVNNFRVDEAMYCLDIKEWCHRNMQDEKCPVFIQYNDKQFVKVEGEGHMFCLLEYIINQ